MKIVVIGLTITSSWGNGHATTYRGLVKSLVRRGHDVLFLERSAPWYAENQDTESASGGRLALYGTLEELRDRHREDVARADLVVVGSYVPEGVEVSDWVLATARGVTAFYDLDTPLTLAALDSGAEAYLARRQVPRFDLYFSFTGGPTLDRLRARYDARRPRPLYCAVDPDVHRPRAVPRRFALGYLGTYAPDRQPSLEALLLEPARREVGSRFAVAGPQYPENIVWPENVERTSHLPPPAHAEFYCAQRFTLNLTRRDMQNAGYSPSVRVFEAAAAATAIISDRWPGLETFLRPEKEVLVAHETRDVLQYLHDLSDSEREAIGRAAQEAVLARHTAAHRAEEVEGYVSEVSGTALATPASAPRG